MFPHLKFVGHKANDNYLDCNLNLSLLGFDKTYWW